MAMQRINGGMPLFYPTALMSYRGPHSAGTNGGYSSIANTAWVIDAAGEQGAFIGQVVWDGGASSKTMDSTSKVWFHTGTTTMANASTTIRIGLQDVATASGPPIQPDGTFDVYREFAGDAGVITSSDDLVIKSVTLSTSGSKTLTNGQLVAVVFEMTARGGADSLTGMGVGGTSQQYMNMPTTVQYTTAWQNTAATSLTPLVMLEASDGTLGTLCGAMLFTSGNVYTYASSSTPDERGLQFQVPFKCVVNSIAIATGNNSATADGELILYSDPAGTPTAMETLTLLGEQSGNVIDERMQIYMLTSEHTLSPGTDYCVAYKATGAGNLNLGYINLNDAAHRSINGFANCSGVSRTDGSGAFGSASTTAIPAISVGIVQLDDGVSTGGVAPVYGG